MLQSTTPRPTLHLATTPQTPSTTPKKASIHNYVRCLAYYIEEFKYYSSKLLPNWGSYVLHQQFSPPCHHYLRYSELYTEVLKFFFDVLKDCWNTRLIHKSQLHVYFLLSTFPPADHCMMWENIFECYVNLQIIILQKYNNENSNSCFTFQKYLNFKKVLYH
jgi:hypothetical protein